MWVPETEKLPALPLMVPAETGDRSPQSMVAVYSLAVALVSGSVKVATVAMKDLPSTALKVVPCALIEPSLTVSVSAPQQLSDAALLVLGSPLYEASQ